MSDSLVPEIIAQDIDKQVQKLLKDLSIVKPPLRLEDVRELLRLDRQYYRIADTDLLSEAIHRFRIGGKQLLDSGLALGKLIEKFALKALFLPDRGTIMLDRDLPALKQRWAEAHEIGHSIIPWQSSLMLGDQDRTLSLSCYEKIEAEANYAAGRLLFLGENFDERLLSSPISMDKVKTLASEFKNSITTTLWKSIESSIEPAFGFIGCHPGKDVVAETELYRHFMRSRIFASRFSLINSRMVFDQLRRQCLDNPSINQVVIVLPDDRTETHNFHVELFHNHYDTLILGIHAGKVSTISMPY